jgi:single-strand DNA-binding protein
MNLAILRGTLSSDPVERVLPSGSRLLTYEVTIPASGELPAESAPVAWLDPPARLPALSAGDEVVVVGRVRRRFFRAGGATASRTEVVAETVVSTRSPARLTKLATGAVARLEAGLPGR